MDDDITFGASVWGTNDEVGPKPQMGSSSFITSPSGPKFDDDDNAFEDFHNTPASIPPGTDEDDEFGDFGDFGEAVADSSAGFDDAGFTNDTRQLGQSSKQWHALRLDPMPSRRELKEEVDDILEPIWGYNDLSDVVTNEQIREVEGVGQILVTPESRELHRTLMQSSPPVKPPNWTHSKIRRQHLIALGIPVNLDEMLPRATSKPLPPLEITTRPMSAPPGPRNGFSTNNSTAAGSRSRNGTPQPSRQPTPKSQFGLKPTLNMEKIDELLRLDPEQLTILPVSKLEEHLTEICSQIAQTSSLLTYLLQMRDTLQQDSETYNGLIAELVGEAQKLKSGKLRSSGSLRRGSGMA